MKSFPASPASPAAVETPGNNEKRYLAGSIHWRTGAVILTEGRPREGRSAALFCRHLDDLRRAFRHYIARPAKHT